MACKGGKVCKVNIASCVKGILPQADRRTADCNRFLYVPQVAMWRLIVEKSPMGAVFLGIYSRGYNCCLRLSQDTNEA
jgi:hypothetical protein